MTIETLVANPLLRQEKLLDSSTVDSKVESFNAESKLDSSDFVDSATYEDDSTPEQFFFVSNGLPLWEVVEHVSKYFGKNIMVYDDIKEKKIFATVQGKELKDVLNCLAWLLGVEYIEKDDIIFLGSNTESILVLPSSGIDTKIEEVFQSVKVKSVGDKVICVGPERSIARVKDAYKLIIDRDYCIAHLYAFEVSYNADLELGMDIDKVVKYTFSWENLLVNQGNPMQALAVSFAASLKAQEGLVRVTDVIDTDIGLLSGKEVSFQTGEDINRAIYNQSQYGERVISGYKQEKYGLIIRMKASYDSVENWYINFYVENSKPEGDQGDTQEYKKVLTNLDTIVKLSAKNPVQLLAKLDAGSYTERMTKGQPFLSEIPLLGYLFRVTEEVKVNRRLFFVLHLKPVDTPVPSNTLDYQKSLFDIMKVKAQWQDLLDKNLLGK